VIETCLPCQSGILAGTSSMMDILTSKDGHIGKQVDNPSTCFFILPADQYAIKQVPVMLTIDSSVRQISVAQGRVHPRHF
jgi:hypothetical protein